MSPTAISIFLAFWACVLSLIVAYCLRDSERKRLAQDEDFAENARELYQRAGLKWYPDGQGGWRRVDL